MRKNLISNLILVLTLATFTAPVWAGTEETADTSEEQDVDPSGIVDDANAPDSDTTPPEE